MSWKVRLVFCSVVLMGSSLFAGGAAQGGQALKVVDAFAYKHAADGGDEMGFWVRLSDHPLDHKALDAAIDFEGELQKQLGESDYVDLEFAKDGSWSGGTRWQGFP